MEEVTSLHYRSPYTFDVAKTKEIFDFLVKEKFITFPKDHQIPNKEKLRGKVHCKYQKSWNHVLTLVRVSRMLSKIGSTREY